MSERSVVISVAEFAETFGVSVNLVYDLMDQGVIPELPRWSRRRLIPRAVVDRIEEEAMRGFDVGKVTELLGVAS
jgi:predicted DNA-binding transcriptional regulator AlpA